MPFGVASTIEGAYKANKVAHKFQKRLELYVPEKTENLLKTEPYDPHQNPDVLMQQATPEEINGNLLAELQAKTHQVDPQEFFGLINEFQQVLQNFKLNLPTIEMMQLTNPNAYGAILDVVNSASQFAQVLMQSGVLNTDLGNMLQQQQMQQEAEQQAQQQPEEGGESEEEGDDSGGESKGGSSKKDDSKKKSKGKPDESPKAKGSRDKPVGTVALSGATYRVKTSDGWRYASKGLGQGPGGEAIPGVGAGSSEEGVEEPQGPRFTDEQE